MEEKRGRYIIDFKDIPSERQAMPEVTVEKRKDNFEEVETGFSTAAAQAEAQRCLSCRRCLGCALCLAVCEPKAIVFEQEDETIDLTVDEIIISPEVETYIPLTKGEYGYRKYINVVSAFEFERILCEHGPYKGLLLRPSDGEIPEKLAFILDSNIKGDKSKQEIDNLLSYIIQEADLALKKVKDLEISIFSPQTGDLKTLSASEKKEGINIRVGKVIEIEAIKETTDLLVTFMEDGEKREEAFEMVAISKQPEIRPEIRELRRKMS